MFLIIWTIIILSIIYYVIFTRKLHQKSKEKIIRLITQSITGKSNNGNIRNIGIYYNIYWVYSFISIHFGIIGKWNEDYPIIYHEVNITYFSIE